MSKYFKAQTQKINAEFRLAEIDLLEKKLPHILAKMNEAYDSYEESNKFHKYFLIHELVYELSFYDPSRVEDILIKYKLNDILLKIFKDSHNLFDQLYIHEQTTTHIFSLKEIYLLYREYSKLIVKRQLATNLGIDIVKVAERMNRQYKNNNSPELLVEIAEESPKIKEILNSEGLEFHFKEKTPFTSSTHNFNFPHKIVFRNLYIILLNINKEHSNLNNENDFKVEFYDLLDILLRDRDILKDDHDSKANYHNIRSFKTKRINSILF